jgi:hypothetical protein
MSGTDPMDCMPDCMPSPSSLSPSHLILELVAARLWSGGPAPRRLRALRALCEVSQAGAAAALPYYKLASAEEVLDALKRRWRPFDVAWLMRSVHRDVGRVAERVSGWDGWRERLVRPDLRFSDVSWDDLEREDEAYRVLARPYPRHTPLRRALQTYLKEGVGPTTHF